VTEDFTEDAYRCALATAKHRYRFEPFGTQCDDPHVLWRHDVDVSVHRARRLAWIEADEGVTSTYFFSLHSSFYNLLERAVTDVARETLAAGHRLGLHFDSAYYGRLTSPDELAERIESEARIIGDFLESPVDAVSFHNPGVLNDDLSFDADTVRGLVNVYGDRLRSGYEYLSDSNGYWRFRPLLEVLAEGSNDRLHVLTHPEWWQASPMQPRERVIRSVEGRAGRTLRDYDDLLASAGRENLR
jgi:hypothetical protein